ncbi:MAG: PH domain-containing protein [Acidobacteriota bacterium]
MDAPSAEPAPTAPHAHAPPPIVDDRSDRDRVNHHDDGDRADHHDDGEVRALDPRIIIVERLAGGIRLLIYGGALFLAVGIALLVQRPGIAGVAAGAGFWLLIALLLGAKAVFWPVIRWRHASYRFGARGLQIRRGVLFRHQIAVPRSRVQHTDVVQGPIERSYGLATLVVHTAGMLHAAVHLPGLAHEDALGLRDQLLDDAGRDARGRDGADDDGV